MSNRENFLYISRFFSGFAGWIVFLAVALMVKDKFGATQVPMTFLFQSIPPLLFSNWLARITPESKMKKVFIIAQVLGVIALFFLNEKLGLIGIYCFILTNSVIQTLTNPLLVTLAMSSVSTEKWQGVHTRLTSIQAATLAIAPIFGGWFSMTFGFTHLLFVTAGCGLLGAIFMILAVPDIHNLTDSKPIQSFKWYQQWKPLAVPNKELKQGIVIWSVFLLVGAFLNTIEFSIFEQQKLSKADIGLMLGAWGIGNLIAFLTSYKIKGHRYSILNSFLFTLALLLFVGSKIKFLSLVSFAVGGFLNSFLAGSLRNQISQSIPHHVRSLDVWAAVNQRMSLINIIIYGVGGYLIQLTSPHFVGGLTVISGLVLTILLFFNSK